MQKVWTPPLRLVFGAATACLDGVHRFAEQVRLRLDAENFFRIDRSHIVNIERVRELQPWFNGEYVVCMNSGARLMLSRGYREKLQERIGRPL